MNPGETPPLPTHPLPHRVASIDIGTNTILLLIAEVKRGELKPLLETETIVGLGKGLQRNGVLSREAMNRGYETLSQYVNRCREMDVRTIFAVGTSALRDAGNSGEFIEKTKKGLHLSIEVISGEEEAGLSFLAAVNDLQRPQETILVADVGGGSTEWILGKGDQVIYRRSLPMGSVRFTEQFLLSDPVREEEWNRMETEVIGLFSDIPRPGSPPLMVAVGGTATTLASVALGLREFDAEKIHHFILAREILKNQLSLYRSKSVAERRTIPGLFPKRADVILAGGAILYSAMERAGCSSSLISCHGIRQGLLYKRLGLKPPSLT